MHTIYKTKDGEIVRSVTEVITKNLGWGKEELMSWVKKMSFSGIDYKEVFNKAGNIGTITHELVNCYLRHKPIPMFVDYKKEDIEKAKGNFLLYLDWEKKHKINLIGNEIPLVSERYRYGGTLDKIAIVDSELAIVDFKTSNTIWPEMLIQLSAYGNLWEENNNEKVKKFIILHLNGTCKPYYFKSLETEFDVFYHLLIIEAGKKKIENKLKKGGEKEK